MAVRAALLRPPTPQIPDHQLLRCIGCGSFGEVWLARNALGTWRAVKVVYHDALPDKRAYQREFDGICRFEPVSRSHPGLVDILQVGLNEQAGHFWLLLLRDGAGR